MKVAEIMTPNPITIGPTDTVGEVDRILFEQGIRQLPVAQGSNLVGIITDRDIRSFLSGKYFDSQRELDRAMSTQVSAIMTAKPISLSPDDDVRDAVELLIEEKIGGIPVADQSEGVVGIVTYVDVLKCFLEDLDQRG
jgi:acetoin utilization protein AcuB